MTSEKPTEWSRLPVDLQHQFFTHAAEEARRCKEKLLDHRKKLKYLSKFLRFEEIPEDDRWRSWRIASVDGSYSPATSERIGARYGTYSSGYMLFRADEFDRDFYRSGKFSQDQVGEPETALRVLGLLCLNLERELALRCLEEEGVDIILMDGSFFGFRSKLSEMRNDEIDVNGFRTVGGLADRVRDLSIRLMNSKRVVGVIKRVRMNAFEGWLTHKHVDTSYRIGRNDRAILASIMPPKRWFAYEWLFGSPTVYSIYAWLSGLDKDRLRTLREKGEGMEQVFEQHKRLVEEDVKRNLRCAPEDVLKTARYYVRCSPVVPPLSFEVHREFDVKPLLAYLQANHNPATGLPFPIDLIDENVSITEGFTREFVEEVEALLISDPDLDKFDLSNYFMSINPQKEE